MPSIAKRLSKSLGGKWVYSGPCYWECDDNKRRVVKCSAGVDEFDNPLGPGEYWLYGDGPPRRAEQYFVKRMELFK